MEEKQNSINEDWRKDVSDTSTATLKIQAGETKEVLFMSEGKPKNHPDFGESVLFEVNVKELDEDKIEQVLTKNFYVNKQNFSLLRQIKEIEKLTGTVVNISRVGEKKSDTRYTVEKVNKE